MVHCHCTLPLYTVTVHCPCTLSMLSLSTVTVHGTLYSGPVRCHCTLHTATAHWHYTLSLYIVTIHCTLYTVLPKVSSNVSPHTVRPPQRPRLYTSTLHCHSTLTVCSHCTLSLYTVTVHCHCKLGAIFFGRGGWYFEPPSLQSSPPPHSYS